MITIKFIDRNGVEIELGAKEGDNLMEIASHNMVDGMVAECGGSCSCATCHCYIEEDGFDKLEPISELENSMLDCVLDKQDNSRLSCQVELTREHDGLVVRLPKNQL